MRRSTAAVGSALFFLLAPGVVVGLVPWALTGGWQVREPLPYWAPARMLGGVVLLAGVIVLVQAFVRFVVEGLGTPAPVAAPERLVVGGVFRPFQEWPGAPPRVGGGLGALRAGGPRLGPPPASLGSGRARRTRR